MSEIFKDLKTELVGEIQELAKDIADSESFIGLVSQQARFQSLNEKFTVLKFLHHKRLGDTVFRELEKAYNLKEQVQTEKENTSDNIQEEVPLLNDKIDANIRLKEEVKNEEVKEEKTEEPPHKIQQENNSNKEEIEDSKIEPIRLDLNDEMGFTQYLFKGDSNGFNSVIKALNKFQNKSSTLKYLDELTSKMNWKSTDEYVERLKEIVTNRFSI